MMAHNGKATLTVGTVTHNHDQSMLHDWNAQAVIGEYPPVSLNAR